MANLKQKYGIIFFKIPHRRLSDDDEKSRVFSSLGALKHYLDYDNVFIVSQFYSFIGK